MTHFQNPLWGKRQRGEKRNLKVQKLTYVWILTPLLPALFPFQSLLKNTSMWVQIAERASTGEQQQKRVKWNILQYHQGSPFVWSLLLYLLSQDPHNYSMCSPERVCTCKCTHAHTSTCIHRANQRRNKIQKRREETRFGMSLSVFYSYIILFPPPMAGNRETWATIILWCDTLLRPLFCTAPANMQAHLSKALKPSLILWRPKHLHFFPTDQFTASPGLPVG